jgi:hypothetical protein
MAIQWTKKMWKSTKTFVMTFKWSFKQDLLPPEEPTTHTSKFTASHQMSSTNQKQSSSKIATIQQTQFTNSCHNKPHSDIVNFKLPSDLTKKTPCQILTVVFNSEQTILCDRKTHYNSMEEINLDLNGTLCVTEKINPGITCFSLCPVENNDKNHCRLISLLPDNVKRMQLMSSKFNTKFYIFYSLKTPSLSGNIPSLQYFSIATLFCHDILSLFNNNKQIPKLIENMLPSVEIHCLRSPCPYKNINDVPSIFQKCIGP